MAPPAPDTAQRTGGLREEESQVQLSKLPPAPTSPPPQQSHHSLTAARELPHATAPTGSLHPFPPYLPALDMAADTGSSVHTRALCELFLALWLKILGQPVLSARRRSRKRRAKESVSDPRMGEEPHGSLKQWGTCGHLPRLTQTDTAGPPRRRKGWDETSQAPRAVFHHR